MWYRKNCIKSNFHFEVFNAVDSVAVGFEFKGFLFSEFGVKGPEKEFTV
jgi:hypothetical protein